MVARSTKGLSSSLATLAGHELAQKGAEGLLSIRNPRLPLTAATWLSLRCPPGWARHPPPAAPPWLLAPPSRYRVRLRPWLWDPQLRG